MNLCCEWNQHVSSVNDLQSFHLWQSNITASTNNDSNRIYSFSSLKMKETRRVKIQSLTGQRPSNQELNARALLSNVMTSSCIRQSTRQRHQAVLAESRSRIDTHSFTTTTGYASKNHGKVFNHVSTKLPWTRHVPLPDLRRDSKQGRWQPGIHPPQPLPSLQYLPAVI